MNIFWILFYCEYFLLIMLSHAIMKVTKPSATLSNFAKPVNVTCTSCHHQLLEVDCGFGNTGNKSILYGVINLKRKISAMHVKARCFRKHAGRYTPFAFDWSFNWCDFVEKRDIPIFDKIFRLAEEQSNLNTKCPLSPGHFYINYTLNNEGGQLLPFNMPKGEYSANVVFKKELKAKLPSGSITVLFAIL